MSSNAKLVNDIKDYVSQFKFKETERDYQIDCTVCGEDRRNRLGINKNSGAWHCFKCNAKGKHFNSLISYKKEKYKPMGLHFDQEDSEKTIDLKKNKIDKDLHLKDRKTLENHEDGHRVYKYLEKRKISKKAIDYFNLGFRYVFKYKGKEYEGEDDFLALPTLVGDVCVNVKYRNIDPKLDDSGKPKNKWKREDKGLSVIFNYNIFNDFDYDEIFITESEIDCISLWCLGYKNTVGLVNGAENFEDSWIKHFQRYKNIYIVLDNDEAGQKGARKIAEKLGLNRCYNVILPEGIKDPNEFLQKNTIDEFEDLLDASKLFDVPRVKSLARSFDQAYYEKFVKKEEPVSSRYVLPWPKLNNLIGPIEHGFLFVIGGKSKSGKTTLCLNLMKHWGEKGINTAIYSCEMQSIELTKKFAMMSETHYVDYDDMDENALISAKRRVPSKRIFIFEPKKKDELQIGGVVEIARAIIVRYGVKILVIDNLHFLCREDSAINDGLIGQTTQQLKLLANEMQVVIILIGHPRKMGHNNQLTIEDLKGSSSIVQDANVIWLMHRKEVDSNVLPHERQDNKPHSDLAEINIISRGGRGGNGNLVLNGYRSLFKDRGPFFNKCMAERYGNFKPKVKKKKGF